MADLIEEVAEHQRTVFGVVDLRMILNAVEAAFFVRDSGGRAGVGVRDKLEALRHLRHVVAVAHPRNALCGQTLEQLAVGVVEGTGLAVLTRGILLRCGDLTAEGVRHELAAVADAEHRNAEVEQSRVALRRGLLVNAVRAAGEDDADRVHGLDFFNRGLVRLYLTEYIMFADAACDQLIILTTEIQHKNELMIFHRQSPFVLILLNI